MKVWQMFISAILPFTVISLVYIFVQGSFEGINFRDHMFVRGVIYVFIWYVILLFPWYLVLYIIRFHYHLKAFLQMGLLFCIVQPIIVSIFLNVRIGSEWFLFAIFPFSALGMATVMVCILLFYREKREEISLN
jgi:hypothetical protein